MGMRVRMGPFSVNSRGRVGVSAGPVSFYGGGFANVRENKLRDDIATRLGADTPPMFVVHAFDDGALSSVILMNALKRANVVSELHLFGAGAEGTAAQSAVCGLCSLAVVDVGER